MKKEISAQDKALGSLIREKRKERSLTGAQVGEYVGVSKSAVSRWENGEVANIQLSRLSKLCSLLGVDPLLFIKNDDSLVKKYIDGVKESVKGKGIDLSGVDDKVIDELIMEALKRKDN